VWKTQLLGVTNSAYGLSTYAFLVTLLSRSIISTFET
jgi:hypothetical protein